ncbi:SDR family NAD(P)-dependent oxidoreductase [Streptomyces sp. YGL11-2]|uniref:SDR family NAD(P)-dependent oxidoreductase n=1 Tax=Streptomyces sp. YGL11-2 TaxID=3414028 RepID=UPI003CE88766
MAMRTLLMTGASRGLGRTAAEHLLRANPDLHLLVTSRGTSGNRLAAELAEATGSPHVSAVCCNLAARECIRAAADEIAGRLAAGDLPPLCGFVGNAGLQLTTRTRTDADGVELTFSVNVLANWLLIRLLWEHFTAPSRIVVVGSDTHFGDLRHNMGMVPAPRWESVQALAAPHHDKRAHTASEGRTAYSTSKLAVLYLVHALARRLPEGIDAYTFNPGYVPGTGLVRDAGPAVQLLSRTVLHALTATPLALSPARAGRLLAEVAAGPRPGPTGAYIDRHSVDRSSAESYDEDREEELWRTAAELCGVSGGPGIPRAEGRARGRGAP